MDGRSDMHGDRVRLSPSLLGKQKQVKGWKLSAAVPMAVFLLWANTDLPWWGKLLLTFASFFTITYKGGR